MSGKRSSKNDDDGMGCLFAMFELLGLLLVWLFSSENPVVRNIGWGIVISIAIFCALVNGGMSGDAAMIVVLVLAMIVIVIAVAWASNKDSGKSESDTTVNNIDTSNNQSVATQKTVETVAPVERVENVSPVTVEQKVAVQKPRDKYYRSVAEALEQHTVPADYQKIMIECIQNTDVEECPGLIWKDEARLYVLPLLKGAKIYHWSLSSVSIILYEKRVNPDTDKEFMEVLQSEIAAEFEDVFPEYYFDEANTYTGKFVLPVGLEVTNKSGKILFGMLPAEFHIAGDSSQLAGYAKEYEELFQKKSLQEKGIISDEQFEAEKMKLLKEYQEPETNEEAIEEVESDWREDCEDGWEYDVDPEDYETEEEYEEALEEAKYGWRDECEDGWEYDVDPEDYETEEEYEEALEEARHGWREECEDGMEYGLDPEDYETEEEYEEALNEEKYGWRDSCIDNDFGIDPEDYETEEEYEEAVDDAQLW